MTKLKNEILDTLKKGQDTADVLKVISQIQENLLVNSDNPVFSKSDKSRILKKYMNLQDVGESLYRYEFYDKNNYFDKKTQEEKDIENMVLKGGVSNCYYVWQAENSENTCPKCKALDGKVFNIFEEIPKRPHPNCRCTVKVIEVSKTKENKLKKVLNDAKNVIGKVGEVVVDRLQERIPRDASKEANLNLNKNYPDSFFLMDLALSPKMWNLSIFPTFTLLRQGQSFNGYNYLSEEFRNAIPNNMPGVIFSKNSHLANSLNSSTQFKNQIIKNLEIPDITHFSVVLDQDTNLFYAIHKAEIYDFSITEDGYFEGYLFDIYDFDMMWNYYNKNITTLTFNDIAYLLQQAKSIVPYCFVVPVKVRI